MESTAYNPGAPVQMGRLDYPSSTKLSAANLELYLQIRQLGQKPNHLHPVGQFNTSTYYLKVTNVSGIEFYAAAKGLSLPVAQCVTRRPGKCIGCGKRPPVSASQDQLGRCFDLQPCQWATCGRHLLSHLRACNDAQSSVGEYTVEFAKVIFVTSGR